MADQADKYPKREVLGEGTYGVVYKAIDTHLFTVCFSRDDNENRTCGYLLEPNPNLTGKPQCDWVRVLPEFKFWVRVLYC
ncbi:hypothetical protein Lal_00029898 [Lupinus albus]|nr:hypothetical protein Lal_00029898 [Lupinus albus]